MAQLKPSWQNPFHWRPHSFNEYFLYFDRRDEFKGFPGDAGGKESACISRRYNEMWAWFLCREDHLEKGMATHSNILAWRIPWTEELGGLQSMRGNESNMTERLSTHTHSWFAVLCLYFIWMKSGSICPLKIGSFHSVQYLKKSSMM